MRFYQIQIKYLLQYAVVMIFIFFAIISLISIPEYMEHWQLAAATSFIFALFLALIICVWLAIIHRKSSTTIEREDWKKRKSDILNELSKKGYELSDNIYLPDNKKTMGYAGPVVIQENDPVQITGSKKVLKDLEHFTE